jgi:hypothetical protein
MRARFYDSEIGRFLSEDPIWSVNLYVYTENNPINKVDYEGTSSANLEISWKDFYSNSKKALSVMGDVLNKDLKGLSETAMKEVIAEFEKEIQIAAGEATEFYAEKYVATDKWYLKAIYGTSGVFSALATEENYEITKQTLLLALTASGGLQKVTPKQLSLFDSKTKLNLMKINDYKKKYADPLENINDLNEYRKLLYNRFRGL